MEFKNKKGFITVYVMLAMMFFVVFVVTASVTASRKIKLQTEANTALYDIYDKNIDNILQKDETTIPIYTQAQFKQIANWINGGQASDEYIYINDTIYFLDGSNGEEDNGKNYYFILKTDLWFDGIINNGIGNTEDEIKSDKSLYPYIPNDSDSIYHKALKEIKHNNHDYKQGHTIHLIVNNKEYLYDDSIKISSPEDFIKIGTNELIFGYKATPNATYEIVENIYLGEFIKNIYDTTSSKYTEEEKEYYINLWENRPNFEGIIDGDKNVVHGIYIDINQGIYGLFNTNKGEIKELTFTDAQVLNTATETKNIDNFGIIAQINSGTISNCNITISNRSETGICSINGNNNVNFTNAGGLVGINEGNIVLCKIEAMKIERSQSY